MVSIARKNLFHDKGRFSITIIALAASLVLIFFGIGMAIGIVSSMVTIIDHTEADIWILNEGTVDLIQETSIIQEDVVPEIGSIGGVKSVHKLIYSVNVVEKASKRGTAMIVGINITSRVGGPWNLISGSIADLKRNNTIIVDGSIQLELGKISIGDLLAISGTSQEIVGISKDAKSFIYPFVFTSHENARKLCRMSTNSTNYILIELEPNFIATEVAKEISEVNGINALLSQDVRKNTANYMLFESGMGLGTVTFAIVGLFVAVVIISLTIYTATMEKIPEFGMLKAIGASKIDLSKILIEQVLWSVTIGYILGLIFSLLGVIIITSFTLLPVKITVWLAIMAYFLTLLLSLLGSFLSIRKVNKIDPAIVFRR